MAIAVVRRRDRGYPPLLAELHDPPERLHIRGGEIELLTRPAVAVVGARSCSPYGREVGRSLARELAAAGLVVISGLARGIDGEAHRGALDAGGPTLAVLGCGIDRDYPRAHADLARRIAESGAIVSEYPPGVEPAPWRFPARNRIIAGLALATVVIEARERSGALITADFALELGRDVFAVPGEITSVLSSGTNGLIRQGAAPLLSSADLFDALGIEFARPQRPRVSPPAGAVLDLVVETPRSADELVRVAGLASSEISAALVELELADLVSMSDGVYRTRLDSKP